MTRPQRIFISHTSEFAEWPKPATFVKAAVDAVIRAGHVPCDMQYFTARDQKSADFCCQKVRACDVYVGLIGLRYGSPVRDRPELSYTELEFEAASEAPPKRPLIFLLDDQKQLPIPANVLFDQKHAQRQEAFRKRLQEIDGGRLCAPFHSPDELEKLIYQAIIDSIGAGDKQADLPERLDWPDGKSPYPGLFAFTLEYAPLFFGRDRDLDAVLAKMSAADGRFLIVSGPSGSGKSSLVAAGVRREIDKGRLGDDTQWRWCRMQPGDGHTPWEPLASALKELFGGAVSLRSVELAAQLAQGSQSIEALLVKHLDPGQALLLFIDQMEELFTSGFAPGDVQLFLERLVSAAQAPASRLRVIGTIRSEFMGSVQESEPVLNLLNAGSVHFLGRILPRALQDMIERPADATGYRFDEGLVEQMLTEAAQEPGSLPLVAYALSQLFERRDHAQRLFTKSAYQAMGGVTGAIGTEAEEVMTALQGPEAAFDRLFAQLVHIERDRPATRKRAVRTEFAEDQEVQRLIQALAGQDCRILVTGGHGEQATVEVAHEKLFIGWPRLKTWISTSGDDLRLIEYEEERAMRWHEGGELPQDLLRKEEAVALQRALTRFKKAPSALLQTRLTPQQCLIDRLDDASLSHQDRLAIGQKLAEFGDTRPGVVLGKDGLPDIAWIDVPGGTVQLEDVKHIFTVKPFRIAKYPVTNAQFAVFLTANDGYRIAKWWDGMEQSQEADKPQWPESNSPRENVSWYETIAFCNWLSARTKSSIRLPTEWEWQQAACSGEVTDGGDPVREYPWPGAWDATRCNSAESGLRRTTAVGLYPAGATKQGVLDMAGNVWEWCLNKYHHPDQPEALLIDKSTDFRVIRGGAWVYDPELLRVALRSGTHPGYRLGHVGFRLVQDMSS